MLTFQVRQAKSYKEKIVGLIGTNSPFPLFFKTRFGIHTFGLKFPIDVLILDDNYQVITLKENLKINKLFFWNPYFSNVLELPSGTISKRKIKPGDHLKFVII